jgi:hypothetical protein
MDATCSSETLIIFQLTTQLYIPEEGNLQKITVCNSVVVWKKAEISSSITNDVTSKFV